MRREWEIDGGERKKRTREEGRVIKRVCVCERERESERERLFLLNKRASSHY